jgi:hypothetical protein
VWILASISGMFLTATRIVGIFILPALLWELFAQEGVCKKSFIKSLTLVVVPLGLLAFMSFNYNQWKDPLLFLHQQGQVLNGRTASSIVFIPQTVFRYLKILFTVSPTSHFEWWIALLEFASFIFATVMIYIAWVKKIRFSYILFSLLCFLPPVLSGTFTGLPRYILILFPVFISLALLENKIVKISYVLISIILLFMLFMFFSKGYLIA